MKIKKLLIIIILTSLSSFSQTKFESGYIINNNDEKINCLIKNNDWKNNPNKIFYKLEENSDLKKAEIKDVKEFGITSRIKFKRLLVNIDRSRNETSNLSKEKKPLFKEEILFLKEVVKGKASLFIYNSNGITRFFYSLDNSEVSQLIYKKYKTSEGKVASNNKFREQIWKTLKCKEINIQGLQNLSYSLKSLQKLFVKYNTCTNSDFIVYKKESRGKVYFVKLKAGVNYGSMKIEKGFSADGLDLNNNLGVKIGFETEYILPFRNDKWAIFIEPSYNTFKGESYYGVLLDSYKINVDFNYIEFALGLRHYLFLNSNSKLNFNAGLIVDIPVNSKVVYSLNTSLDPTLNDINVTPGVNFGVGYNYKKFSFEANFGLSRSINGEKYVPENYLLEWESTYQNVSFVVAYTIF